MTHNDERETIAYGLWKSGIIKPPQSARGQAWDVMSVPEKTVFFKAADAIIAEQALRNSKTIRTPEELTAFANEHGLRPDWHEPDNQQVGARIIGDHLDNAMGDAVTLDKGFQEFVVVLTVDGKDAARVNLATLLSWATAHGKSAGAPANGKPV